MGSFSSKFPPMVPRQEPLDHQAFMGSWWVISCIPTYFEKGAHNSLEEYTWNEEKQRIDVKFVYNPGSFEAKKSVINQKAYLHNDAKTEWRISPFWPIKLPYIILEVDESKYCVIGYPSRDYLWIMSREKTIDETLYNDILGRLTTIHAYDLKDLYKVPHQ